MRFRNSAGRRRRGELRLFAAAASAFVTRVICLAAGLGMGIVAVVWLSGCRGGGVVVELEK